MQQEKRKRLILDTLSGQESITVQEIVNKCNVSEITARRDLIFLESKNLIIRTHGGALKSKNTENLFNYILKINKTPNKN